MSTSIAKGFSLSNESDEIVAAPGDENVSIITSAIDDMRAGAFNGFYCDVEDALDSLQVYNSAKAAQLAQGVLDVAQSMLCSDGLVCLQSKASIIVDDYKQIYPSCG